MNTSDRLHRRTFVSRTLALAAGGPLAAVPSLARASTYPTRPLKMIVPFNAGASVDTMARAVAQLMGKRLNQTVVVENKPGANAAIAAQAVASAPADGYTLFFASDSALVLNGLLYKKLAYDAERDFTAVGLAANVPLVMLVNATLPVTNLSEFIAYGKQNIGRLNYSSTGVGGAFHLAAEMFSQHVGLDMTHVPYTGGNPALQALLAGEVQVMFGIVGSSLPHVRSGRLRALALVTKERLAVLPGIPTLQESGYPGLEAPVRYGVVIRKATPPEILGAVSDAFNFALADAGYRDKLTGEGYVVPPPHAPADFNAQLAADRVMWSRLIKARGIALD